MIAYGKIPGVNCQIAAIEAVIMNLSKSDTWENIYGAVMSKQGKDALIAYIRIRHSGNKREVLESIINIYDQRRLRQDRLYEMAKSFI